jgi:hypothetical protein
MGLGQPRNLRQVCSCFHISIGAAHGSPVFVDLMPAHQTPVKGLSHTPMRENVSAVS